MKKQLFSFALGIAAAVLILSLTSAERAIGQSPAASRTWEYKYLTLGYSSDAESKLKDLGKDGWELVTVATDHGFAFFKRPK